MPALVKKPVNGKASVQGVEVTEICEWQGWQPGREYTKNIVLKNVRVKTQKLKYKVPETRFFTTLYPQPIVLSAGTSFTLPITFRPLERVIYDDKVEFTSSEGKFSVPLRAVLPQFGVEAPEHLQFPMCAAMDYNTLTFDITNVSELVTPFAVECMEPFVIEPSEGILEPFSSLTLTATFKPKAAVVYEATAVVKYGTDLSYAVVTRFEGIGKYPHLLVSGGSTTNKDYSENETLLNFGSVAVGRHAEKWIELKNLSPVNAPFTIEQPTCVSRIDTVFACQQQRGVVPAMSGVRIPISFSPNTIGVASTDYFLVKAIGNISKTIVRCVGTSKGPRVRLSHSVLNLKQVDLGQRGTAVLDIINEADCPATFQFCLDCHESVFKFELVSGTLAANTKKSIIVNFEPTHPINYYRRVTCLVHNQDAVFVDLLGTCHSETVKPAPLMPRHVHKYRVHAQRGLSLTAPEHLNEMVKAGNLKLDDNNCLYDPKIENQDLEKPLAELAAMDEYFNDGYYSNTVHSTPHVSMDEHQIDFGQCPNVRNIVQKHVTLTNHTQGKVLVHWMCGEDRVFNVSPEVMEIPPLKSCAFVVTFRPNAGNELFGAELECYVSYKSVRDYRLVEDNTHCPPWCLTLLCKGQTFQKNMETFLPRFELDQARLVFAAVNAHEATYRTLRFSNTGTTPVTFDFAKDPTGIYSVKPTKGLVLPNEHQIFVVKCQPTDVKTYKHTLVLNLNEMEKNKQEILALGSAEAPEVLLENDGVLYFKPTCLGTGSMRQYAVKNVSRIPLRFEWHLKHADAQHLHVSPQSGVIQPNESQYHTWMFSPKCEEKLVMKPAIVVWGQGQRNTSSGGKKRQFVIRAVGEGSMGQIVADRAYMDFATVVVGTTVSKHIVLVNNSDCSLHYSLNVEQKIEGPYPEEHTRYDHIALELERTKGTIPARSRHVIRATVRPARRVYYQWSLSYQLITPQDEGLSDLPTEPQHLCHILATGVHPTMAVTDARCYGSAVNISKKQLWNLFTLDNLNICLDSDPSAAELMYDMSTRHSHHRRPPVYTRAIMDFNFSAAPVGADPCVVQLMVENTCAVPCEWALLTPGDLQLELEYWAETGEFEEDELHEMKVQDNKLFLIEPRRGTLEPGETRTVTLTYKHVMAGTDRLPVLLKLAGGREILLNFVGVTVDNERPYVHFPSNKHMFAPVPIGDKNSPKQMYELYNGGAQPVQYSMDLAPLEMLRSENFDHPILRVLNPTGHVPPGHTALIECYFSPLEAKTYMVDVPIHIHNGDTAVITFTGVGYDKRVMGQTMPLTDQPHELAGVPSVQSVAVPGQLCFLSQERLSFSNVPLFSKARRLSMLTNRSLEHSIAFRWHVTNPRDGKIVTISPSEGMLEPGECRVCRVTFYAIGEPSFFDIDLICEVTNLTQWREFEQQVRAWEDEKTRQSVEFTVTEHDPDADLRLPDLEERPPSGRLKSLESSVRSARTPTPENLDPDAEFIKYRTLPPIRKCLLDTEGQRERGKKRFEEHFWRKPSAPRPFLLHLGVTARTHHLSDFQQNFPDHVKNFITDRALSEQQSGVKQDEALPQPRQAACLQAESAVVADALATILMDLLGDTELHDSCEKVMKAETPVYPQFTEYPLPHPLPDAPSANEPAPEITFGTPMGSVERLDLGCDAVRGHKSASSSGSASSLSSASSSSSSASQKEPIALPYASTPKEDLRPESVDPETEQNNFQQNQIFKKLPEFGSLAESVIENTLMNIMQEALSQEFNISARPRLVALPAKQRTPRSRVSSAR